MDGSSLRNGYQKEDEVSEMPEWKRQIYEVRMAKQKHEEELRKRRERELQEMNNEVPTQEPLWKKEIVSRKQEKLKTSNDQIMIRKRKIQVLESEMNSSHTPQWQKDLLQRKIDKIQGEIDEILNERRVDIEKRNEVLAGPMKHYKYVEKIDEPFEKMLDRNKQL